MPYAIIGNGFVGWRDGNLEIVSPQFTGAVKRGAKIDGARFRRNVGDYFNFHPIRRAEGGAVSHWIAGKNVSISIDDHQRRAGHDFDLLGLEPTGNTDSFSQERRVGRYRMVSETAGLKRPVAGIDGPEIIGGAGRCWFDETFDMSCRQGVGGAPEIGSDVVGKSIVTSNGSAKSEKS